MGQIDTFWPRCQMGGGGHFEKCLRADDIDAEKGLTWLSRTMAASLKFILVVTGAANLSRITPAIKIQSLYL